MRIRFNSHVYRDASIETSLALVTSARLKFDKKEFTAAVSVATKLTKYNKNAAHQLRYEECLWALYQNNTDVLKQLLEDWTLDSGDPYWGIRKSTLLFESGCARDQVLPLLKSGLASLRRLREHSRALSNRSREAWATYLAQWHEQRSWSDADGSTHHRARAHDLIRLNCDPHSEIRALTTAIQWQEIPQKGPGFELGEGSRPRRLIEFEQLGQSGSQYRAHVAFRIIRLAEVVGLPRLSDPWSRFQFMLRQACQELHRNGQFELSLRLMIRLASGDGDELVRILLSRPNLAMLPQNIVNSMGDMCEQIVEEYSNRNPIFSSHGQEFATNLARVAMEVLARLSLRFDLRRSSKTVLTGLTIYSNPLFYSSVLFREPIRNLLSWSWEAVHSESKPDLTLEVLQSPIVGVDGYTPEPYAFIEPGSLIDGDVDAIPERNDNNEELWSSTVSFLLRALRFGNEARYRAIVRIVQVALAGRLTEVETQQLACALWTRTTTCDEVPIGHKSIKNWVYLLMPELSIGQAEQWFRSKWMTEAVASSESAELLDDALFQVSDAIAQSVSQEFSLEFSDNDFALLQKMLNRWANASISKIRFSVFERDRIEQMYRGIQGAARLMLILNLHDNTARALYHKHQALYNSEIPAMLLLVGLLRSPLVPKNEIHTALRKSLSSSIPSFVADAANAISFWLHSSDHFEIPRPPTDLIREIGVIIATRRIAALNDSLSVAEWIFSNGRLCDQREIWKLCIEGLNYLIRELGYDQQDSNGADVPLLRWRCVSLARAMKESGISDDAVDSWLDAALADPLPEVRHEVSRITM